MNRKRIVCLVLSVLGIVTYWNCGVIDDLIFGVSGIGSLGAFGIFYQAGDT